MKHRESAYALLRITLGVIFLFYGVGKFMGGIGNFVSGMNQHFSGKLPAAMVVPFAYALPFCEVIAGALILIGLTFGTVMLGDAPTVAHNLQYALVNFVLLWFVDLNRYSLDAWFGRRNPVGFTA